jgi:hypothetical protein
MNNAYVVNKLFAEPSFMEGMARIVDIGATMQLYNTSENQDSTDAEALINDWRAIGCDLRNSMKTYEQKLAAAK